MERQDDKPHPDHAARERRDAAAHRRRILTTARELFAANGVEATSMHEIAREACVGQGTLYRRFAHKGALCAALLADSSATFSAEMESAFAAAGPEVPALELLAMLLDGLTAFNEAHGPLLGAIVAAAAGSRRCEVFSGPFYSWLHTTTVALLERAVTCREIAPLDVECAADMILAPLAIDVYLYQRQIRGLSRERIGATLRRLFVEGLRRSP